MNISSTRLPARTLGAKPKQQFQTNSVPQESTVLGERPEQQDSTAYKVAKAAFGAVVGGGVGYMAGLNSGTMAGFAGAAVTALPGAFVGGVSGALLAERVGQSDSSGTVGAGLWGAVLGGAVGAAGGAFLGSQLSGTAAALSLGAVGSITGLMALS